MKLLVSRSEAQRRAIRLEVQICIEMVIEGILLGVSREESIKMIA